MSMRRTTALLSMLVPLCGASVARAEQPEWQPALERQFESSSPAHLDVLVEFRTNPDLSRPNRERSAQNFERALDTLREGNLRAAAERAEALTTSGMEVLRTYDYVPTLLVRIAQKDIATLAAKARC
jgi:hypothetical protein